MQLKCNSSKDISISVETKKMNDFDLTIINVDGGRQLKKLSGYVIVDCISRCSLLISR